MKKHLLILICSLMVCPAFAGQAEGQSGNDNSVQQSEGFKVSGIITDNLGDPIAGATIIVKGTTTGAISGTDGSYMITAPYSEATITVSYMGYAPQEIGLERRPVINITLIEDSKALEEVVVVGYNVQRRETITGSVATITTKELKQSPTANVNNALAGRLPGLLVNQFVGGEPGNDVSQINVRGISTYGSTNAIMIVDGIERDFSYLSPDEIETFTILKDASATAPYGIRGANGVIIVTTKRGRTGEKPTVDFKASVGISEPVKYPKYLGSADYAQLYNEAIINDNPGQSPSSLNLFSDEAIANYRMANGDNSDGLGYSWDYFDYAFKPSVLQDYSLSVRGGTDVARYFILGNYYKQGGNYKHTTSDNENKFIRYNFRANVDVNATKRFKISVDLGARVTEFTYPGASAANIISLANTQPPFLPITLSNNGNDTNPEDFNNNGGYLLYADDVYRYNMLGQLNRTGESTRTQRYLNGSIKLTHDLDFITKGLSIGAQFSYDTYNRHTVATNVNTFTTGNLTYPGYSTWKLQGGSSDQWMNEAGYWAQNGIYEPANTKTVDDAKQDNISYVSPEGTARFQARIDYARKFGSHDVSAMVLGYMQSKRIGKDVPYRYMGATARATYSYANKYLAEFNIGYNGSENFDRGNRFGVFPAGSIGWVISQENFMKNVGWVNFLKVRASYGLVGNDVLGSYRFLYLQNYKDGTTYNAYFGSSDVKGWASYLDEDIFANTSLTWEKAEKFNVGIDASFFNQRLHLSVDFFREHRYDIITDLNSTDIVRLGLPYIVGNKTPLVNSGIVNNHGFEVELGWEGKIGRHFRYFIKPNVTFARNKIIYTDEISYIDNNGNDCTWRYATGKRIGENFCYVFDHFIKDQAEADALNASSYQNFTSPLIPGDVVYKDINGDGVIDDYDRAATGNPRIPEIQFGLPIGFSIKNFDVSLLFQGSALCSVQLSGPAVWDFPLYDQTRVGKVKTMHLDRWTPETAETAKYPALHAGIHTNNKNEHSSLFLYNASYVRLKNFEIGYSLPNKWLAKANIQSVRIYVQGQNLLTFDKLKDIDMDPEVKNGDGSWFPVQRVFNFGVNMVF